jgi:hypothetical protein
MGSWKFLPAFFMRPTATDWLVVAALIAVLALLLKVIFWWGDRE